jgi:hypothetical protein
MKICEYCGKSFEPNTTAKFCCRQCGDNKELASRRFKTQQHLDPTIQCGHCGKRIIPVRCDAKWCSSSCKQEAYKAGIRERYANQQKTLTSRSCEHCGTVFTPKRYRDRDQKFCCRVCKRDYHKAKNTALLTQIRRKTVKQCPICDKLFTPADTMKQRYCSKKCQRLIGKKVYSALRNCYLAIGTKKEDHARNLLGYTPKQLLEHLQTFPQWNKLRDRDWHLDHIFPIKAFIDHGIKDVKIMCALSNLQPLVGKENMRKNKKYDNSNFNAYLREHICDT